MSLIHVAVIDIHGTAHLACEIATEITTTHPGGALVLLGSYSKDEAPRVDLSSVHRVVPIHTADDYSFTDWCHDHGYKAAK